MTQQLGYGTPAKGFHWTIVFLLIVQYLIGWFMPDIHRDMKPGDAMTLHISIGIVILLLTAARLIWRLGNPVPADNSLPNWQRVTSASVHWSLYALVLATTVTGWFFASFRGWSISLFFAVPLPLLAAEGSQTARAIGHWHQSLEWALLIVIGIHVAAAMAHLLIYRDKIMQRMLPG